MLRVHEIEAIAAGGPGQGEPVQFGLADSSGRRVDDTRLDGAPASRHLHLHGVLQDGLPGDLHRRHARHVLAAGVAVPLRARRLQRRARQARTEPGGLEERRAREGAAAQASAALRDPASSSSLLHRERRQAAPGQSGDEHGGIRGAGSGPGHQRGQQFDGERLLAEQTAPVQAGSAGSAEPDPPRYVEEVRRRSVRPIAVPICDKRIGASGAGLSRRRGASPRGARRGQ